MLTLYTELGTDWLIPEPELINDDMVIVVVGLEAVEFSNVKSGKTFVINAKWSPVGSEMSNSEDEMYASMGAGVPVSLSSKPLSWLTKYPLYVAPIGLV